MAQTPSISSIPTSTTSGQTPGGNVPVGPITPTGAAPAVTLTNIPVRQAPAEMTNHDARSAPVDGKVISSNLQTQSVRIQTAAGQVEVQSSTPLPPDTRVTIQVYTDRNRMLANIVVLSQAAVESKQVEKAAPPPPPLKEGQTVTALLLPELPAAEIKDQPLAAKPPQVQQSATPNSKESIQPLSPLPQKEYPVPIPSALRKLMAAYLPQALAGRPHIPATAESSAPDTLDNNLMQITRAQMHAKTAQQALQSLATVPQTPARAGAAAPFSAQNVINTLLSLAETTEPQPATLTATAFRQTSVPLPENMYHLTILKILPPQTPPEQVTTALQNVSAQTAQPTQAKIEAITPGGFPILKTDDSHFVIKTPFEIPVGSIIIFKAVPLTAEQIVANGASGVPATGLQPGALQDFDPVLSTTWPALHEALRLMQQNNPAGAEAFTRALPTPTQHLAPAALFFLAALRLGIVDNWVGGNVLKTLQEIGKKDLADRLGSDFGKISRLSKEPLGDDWRVISIPLLHDEKISQLQFYVRQQPDQDGRKDGDQKTATRFILNLQLSRMGEMQLDGYLQKKSFDIVLRSAEKLPFDMRQELMKRFASGLEQVNMQGGISFQTRQQGWVIVEMPPQSGVMV